MSWLCIRWPEHCSFSFCISLPINIQGWFLLGLTGWFPCSTRDSQESFQQHNSKASVLQLLAFFMVQLLHPYMTTGKTVALTLWTFVDKVLSLLLNILSKVCQSFPSKEQVSFNFLAAVTICSNFGAQDNKICHCFHFFSFYLPWSDGTGWHDLTFCECWVLNHYFHSHLEAL